MNAEGTTEAVVLLGADGAVKEMLFPEFEAILDNVVALVDFKSQKVRGAYLQINNCLQITSVVCFYTDFDSNGFVDKSWNLPLSRLAATGTCGPDLGAGPIKISCRSHCSVSWHQRHLWDPDLQVDAPFFQKLLALMARNRLGIVEQPPQVSGAETAYIPTLNEAQKYSDSEKTLHLQKKYKTKLHQLNEEYTLKLAALKSEANDHIERLQKHYSSELQKQRQQLTELNEELVKQRRRNQHYKATLDNQAKDLGDAREKFQAQLSKAQGIEESQLNELHEKYQQESRAQIDNIKAELKEMLEMREVELFYREEQITALREEVAQLRQEKQELLNNSGGRVLQQLADEGVSFVSYCAGVDPVAIPAADIGRYLDSPNDYMAEQLGVDPQLYRQWLDHCELPLCGGLNIEGSTCGEPIAKISKPSRFIPGESDRCAKHNSASEALSDIIRMRETH